MLPLIISLYDRNGIQYNFNADGRDLRFTKSLYGGEDILMSLRLAKSLEIDHPEVGYGQRAELWYGIDRRFLGEQREIEEVRQGDQEYIDIRCAGYWVILDDYTYGEKGKLWADTRYEVWEPTTQDIYSVRAPDRNRLDTNERLYLAPQVGESFGSPNYNSGALHYRCPFDNVARVTFDYDVMVPGSWKVHLIRWPLDWSASVEEWLKTGVHEVGSANITLTAERPIIEFVIYYNGPECVYAGGPITVLRYKSAAYTDYSIEAESGDTVLLADMTAGDYLYIGSFKTPFSAIRINRHADENVNASVMSAQYWNGSTWAGLTITDGTAVSGVTLNTTGDVTFERPTDWAGTTVNGIGAWWVRLAFSATLSPLTSTREIKAVANTGDVYATITNLRVLGSTDTTPIASDVAGDVVDQLQADTPISSDKSLIETINLILVPLVFEREETCHDALATAAFFGDSQHKLYAWGVESGGDRVFIRRPDYASVRYVVGPRDADRLLCKGTTAEDFATEGYGKYADEDGMIQYTDKYYVHVTGDGLVANTTGTGDDLASTVFGVRRSVVVDFGPVASTMAADVIQQYLIEHAHPLTTSSISVRGPVRDLRRGGARVLPFELELGYLVQIPWFRAAEAEGAANSDLRDWSTTFLLAGLEYDHESGVTRLIPEEDRESLTRLLSYTKKMEL